MTQQYQGMAARHTDLVCHLRQSKLDSGHRTSTNVIIKNRYVYNSLRVPSWSCGVRAVFSLPPDLHRLYVVSVVPVQRIRRSCHLVPHFAKKILSADNSLDCCRRFSVRCIIAVSKCAGVGSSPVTWHEWRRTDNISYCAIVYTLK
ncbi:hypothetical protein JB92DRAFT_2959070 [Gautieria morchelliformis]|nr:hypothetical protein JB92DRAFT_2959070 [Gautieria morchelliformis]